MKDPTLIGVIGLGNAGKPILNNLHKSKKYKLIAFDIDKNKLNEVPKDIIIANSIKELAEKIAHLFKYDGEIIWNESMPDGTFRKKLDTSKLDNLGWTAEVDIDEGLKRTIEHFKYELYNNNIRV